MAKRKCIRKKRGPSGLMRCAAFSNTKGKKKAAKKGKKKATKKKVGKGKKRIRGNLCQRTTGPRKGEFAKCG